MISVCMPTYNGEKFIRIQLESILSQLGNDDEVVISDDSSTDKTVEIIKSFNDSRIHLLENNSFHSPIYNLENALKNAKGDFIFLSDQDDEWTVDKVSVCMEKLKDCDLLIHDANIVDGNGNQTAESFFKLNHTKKGKFYNLLKNGYLGCCMCFSKKLLNNFLPFPEKLPMHDIYIGNFAAFNDYRIKFIEDKLIHYRRHGNNASITSEHSHRKLLSRLSDRIIILKNI
ncbi:glycosyltransferase family 2 protein [uncultured Treponema sp.]|uniref:glycosyltransferase family 2 protein n=1 Tax=uncultured Treponema sp. TaxID=162155 RepID=UPI0025FCC95C|nr:glycosyltransferase family 2 protein [uncultured Treponema sp.]